MLQKTVETNVVTLNSALSAQQWHVAMHLFTKAKHGDVVTFNASISSLEKGNRWKDASMLLTSSSQLRLRLDEFSSSAVMTSYAGAWKWENASHLLQLMKKHFMELTLFSCNAFHSACERARHKCEILWRKSPTNVESIFFVWGIFVQKKRTVGCVKGDVKKDIFVSHFYKKKRHISSKTSQKKWGGGG